jgi:hypothetical protein
MCVSTAMVLCVPQAAVDAGRPYVWTIDTTVGAGAGPEQLAALVTVMTRCLAPEAADRPTSAALVTTLTQMKAGGPVPAFPSEPVPPPAIPVVPVNTGASYDVLAIMDAMEAQGIDAGVVGAVGDAIGHLDTSTLDILKTCGVPPRALISLKKGLITCASSVSVMAGGCCCAVVLLCCCAVVLLCCCTVVLLYCCAVVLLCCCAVVLLCCCAVVLLCCCAVVLLCCCAAVLLCCCAVVLLCCCAAVLTQIFGTVSSNQLVLW